MVNIYSFHWVFHNVRSYQDFDKELFLEIVLLELVQQQQIIHCGVHNMCLQTMFRSDPAC